MKNYSYKTKLFFLLAALGVGLSKPAHALTVSNVTFSDTNITYETGGIPNGTTIGFTIDTAGLMDYRGQSAASRTLAMQGRKLPT